MPQSFTVVGHLGHATILGCDNRITGVLRSSPSAPRDPPEPSRYAGGSLTGRALLAKDSAADEAVGTVRLIALPRGLGLWLPR